MLTVVGMGPSGLHLMTPAAREAVATADALVGGKRHLQQFPGFRGERFALGANIAELLVWLGERAAQKVVVLASGDPLFYGIGTRLIAHFGIDRVRIIPRHQRGAVSLREGRYRYERYLADQQPRARRLF